MSENNPSRNLAENRNPQSTARQPRYSDGFTMIPPNESQRSKMKMMAQKEEEDLQRWKENNRVPSVHLPPERVGGVVSQAEARARQQAEFHHSKWQKKIKQQVVVERSRKEEEEELQKMKEGQRQKADHLKEKQAEDEQRRAEQLRQDHLSMNSAFLDKLEAPVKASKKETTSKGAGETERPCVDSEAVQNQLSKMAGQQADPEQCGSSWPKEAEPETDPEWALVMLVSMFPGCSTAVLEDILIQCGGDFQQACTLLS